MSVLNPRNRLVNFRLSESELELLKAACHTQGARSISEFARMAVLRSLNGTSGSESTRDSRVSDLDSKVNELENRMDQLSGLLAIAGATRSERATPPQPTQPINGELRRY